jgi:hypothetical protein
MNAQMTLLHKGAGRASCHPLKRAAGGAWQLMHPDKTPIQPSLTETNTKIKIAMTGCACSNRFRWFGSSDLIMLGSHLKAAICAGSYPR